MKRTGPVPGAPAEQPRRRRKVKETVGDTASVVELRVAKEDLGRIIGKQGRTAKSIHHSQRRGIARQSQGQSSTSSKSSNPGAAMEPPQWPPRPVAPPARDEPIVALGPIVNRHGIRGEVRLLPHNLDSETVEAAAALLLCWPDGRREPRRVRAARRHKRFVLLQLEGVDDATAAEALVGYCSAPRAALPPAEDDAFYHADLLGCAVVTTAGEALGTVCEMLVTGSNDVCVVRDAAREVLVPMVADVIAEVDVRRPAPASPARCPAGRRRAMRFHVVTLFPELFDSVIEATMLKKGRERGAIDFIFHDIRGNMPLTGTASPTTRPTAAAPAW
ncbi:MAG: ribosome maturation factor RimM [Candidatus Binatia bacterium]